jgi:hypothetical protein
MLGRRQLHGPFGLCAVVAFLSASQVNAQEACITCTGPDQAYLCSVEKSDKIRKFASAAEKAIQFACIKEMAKIGGHATCQVRRDTDVATCNGLPQTVLLRSLLEAAQQEAAEVQAVATPPKEKLAPQQLPPGSSPPDAPKTVVEMARRANEQTAEQLRQAGEQVGSVVDKTWTCMTSLFQRC